MYITMLLIAISLSVDSLGVGCAYGLKQIKIPPGPKLFISVMTLTISLLSILLGRIIFSILPPVAGTYVSILILSIMGIYMIISAVVDLKAKEEYHEAKIQEKKQLVNICIKSLGLSISIIKHPQQADLDHSNIIDLSEAFYIGLALSLDSIGACVGLGINAASSIYLPLFVGVFQYFFLSMGLRFGKRLGKLGVLNEKLLSFLPGVIMLGIAVVRLFHI